MSDAGSGPFRGRRLRRTPALRRLVTEVRLHPADFVLPLFVKDDLAEPAEIASMPGVFQHPVDSAVRLVGEALEAGVSAFLLFGIPADKDEVGSSGWDPDGPVPRLSRAVRTAHGGEPLLLADVCSCEYTSHGHCGPLDDHGVVDNDAAVAGYVRESVVYAEAGVDLLAPSGMMDGQVAGIRAGLDAAGHRDLGVVGYAAKYHSSFYGPFRDAAESGMAFGDRRTHQMDPAVARDARPELLADVDEGADAVIVKPALPYLDVVARARATVDVPVIGYQVSGEYAMVAAADRAGWVDGPAAMEESLVAIRRAGADAVITYAAVDVARRLA
ncbi:porphobilinogen synthase [Salsipaludibacter albus]|uniref:porphobilinogen synthase n=1 Tax=Salsipaludibacter albus TaxID=2849650 RepID=UPI001EE48AB3|nr:porphobilinogen synthase [Salsipaludibacter albus]